MKHFKIRTMIFQLRVSRVLQKLLFLIRNFKHFKQDKSTDQGKDFLQAFYSDVGPEVKKSLEAIRALFETVEYAFLPRPSVSILENSDKNTTCAKDGE